MDKKIKSEKELIEWFKSNYKALGYSKIIKDNKKIFPDFIMLKKGVKTLVELETKASHFILHRHDKNKVDEVVCIEDDAHLGIPVLEIKGLVHSPRITRISATIDKETRKTIEKALESGRYRNLSHFVEDIIKSWGERNDKK